MSHIDHEASSSPSSDISRRRRLTATLVKDLGLIVLAFFFSIVGTVAVGSSVTDSAEKMIYKAQHLRDGEQPDCANPGWFNAVPRENIDASATRTYTGDGELEHVATRTLDNDTATAWAGRAVADNGEKLEVSISWTFTGVVDDIKLLCIKNGHVGNGDTYVENHRIKQGEIDGCAGDDDTVDLLDYPVPRQGEFLPEFRKFQTVRLACAPGSVVTLRIKSTFPAVGDSQLVAISDVRFFSGT